jgi:hypothetical protein
VRRVSFTLVGLALVGAALAPAAEANTLQADCSNFGTQLTAAGTGDTIVLSGLCTAGDAFHTLPGTSNLTIEGAASGTNGFDGTGVAIPALASPAGGTDGISIRSLTFENYGSSAVRILSPSPATSIANQYSFSGDQFLNNTSTGNPGGGLDVEVFTDSTTGSCTAPAPTISLSGSSFSGNSGLFRGGGAYLDLECRAGSPTITVANNTFTGNSTTGTFGAGGGLFVSSVGNHVGVGGQPTIALTQSGNLFSGNSMGSANSLSGAGEETDGANVTSTSDTYVNNSMPGMSASGNVRWGSGLSSLGTSCTSTPGATSTFTNLVAAGNTIGAPSGSGTGGLGAGVYVGCAPSSGTYNLTLVNPTISGNTASGSGGVAGIGGHANDSLNVMNGIVFGNQGADLGGFGASPGANVTAANSDVCAVGASTPFAGAGNICTDPLLVNPATGDVHETAASPTIDAGSNAFVPGGVGTDVFGAPRIVPGKAGDAAVVDMGAAEFQLPAQPSPSAPDNSFKIGKVKGKTLFVTVHAPGIVRVIQARGSGRLATASAKKRLLKPSSASGGPGTVKVRLKLTARAKKKLKKKGKLKVKAQVTFTPTGGTANSKRATLRLKHKHRR